MESSGRKQFNMVLTWIRIYKDNKPLRTPQDDANYKRIAEQHKGRLWAYGVIGFHSDHIQRRITEKQLQVILKAVKILN